MNSDQGPQAEIGRIEIIRKDTEGNVLGVIVIPAGKDAPEVEDGNDE